MKERLHRNRQKSRIFLKKDNTRQKRKQKYLKQTEHARNNDITQNQREM